MSDLRIQIYQGTTEYLDVSIKAEEDVAQVVTAEVTKILAEASSTQPAPAKA